MDRRRFLGMTAASQARIPGANDRVRVGLIGCGGRGSSDLRTLLSVPGTECIALCDVDRDQSARARKVAPQAGLVTQDFRRVLDLKDLDAVIVATPDHWHALCMIMACQAGKDVYTEKPLSLTVAEGRAMVDAAAKSGRIVQVGNQRRSGSQYAAMAEYIQSGKLGKIRFVRSWAYLDWIGEIPPVPDTDPPPSVDYDMWLGPAPKRAFNRNRFHFTFRWYWDYANGLLTDWGAHLIDVCIWIMGVKAPLAATATGGKLGYPKDSMETPDTLNVAWEYPDFTMIWEHAIGIGRGPEASEHGVEVHGNNGVLLLDAKGWRVVEETRMHGREKAAPAAPLQPVDQRDNQARHLENFVRCVRSREKPNSGLEAAHTTMIACHLGNIAYRTGRRVAWDPRTETIPGDPEARKYLAREYRAPWAGII